MTDPTLPVPDPGADTTVTPTPASPSPADPWAVPTAPSTPPMTPPSPPTTIVASGEPAGHEPAPAVATATVSPVGAASARPRGRLRWAVALVVVALVVTASAAAAFVLTSGSTTATVLGYVPSDSVAYGELRLDLPGDQKQAVGEFLSKFPGFADQAALDSKLDEVLDQLVGTASDGKQTFTKDIKPWFDGEMAFAVGPLPTTTAATQAAEAPRHGLVLLSIKDAALATTWFADAITRTGVTTTTETYQGVELTVTNAGSLTDKTTTAFGIVDGKVALIGDLPSVKAAIDTGGKGGLASDPGFTAAADTANDPYLGFMYVDLKAIVDAGLAMGGAASAVPQLSSDLLGLVPDWAAFHLRVESDAIEMDAAMPHTDAAPGPDQNGANDVASWAPPTTIALAAANDYGTTLKQTIDLYRKDPSLKDAFAGIDQAAGVLGGLDAAIGWMGDSGIVVNQDGASLEGGIISIPADAAGGRQLLTTLGSFAALGGANAGIKVTTEDYQGTKITIIDLGSLQSLAGMAGALGGQAVPAPSGSLPDANVRIAYAATDGIVVIGSGPDFVKAVLDAGAGTSLADEARFQDLLGRVGTQHTGIGFVDLAAVRSLIESNLGTASAADKTKYEQEIKPFLEPLDAVIAASSVEGGLDQHHAAITVK